MSKCSLPGRLRAPVSAVIVMAALPSPVQALPVVNWRILLGPYRGPSHLHPTKVSVPNVVSRQVSVIAPGIAAGRETDSRQVSVNVAQTPTGTASVSRQITLYNELSPKWSHAVSRQLGIMTANSPIGTSAVSRQVAVEFSQVTVVAPASMSVKLGRVDRGTVASLAAIDDDSLRICKFIVPNQSTPPVNVELSGTCPTPSPTTFAFRAVSKMSGFGQFGITLELWNWTANGGGGTWDPVDVSNGSVTTSFTTTEVVASGAIGRYIRAGDQAIRARYRVRATGIVGNAAWCHEADQAVWLMTP